MENPGHISAAINKTQPTIGAMDAQYVICSRAIPENGAKSGRREPSQH
ncbi:hypothetical protein WSK_3042 [Novosphingobium sp. Rr 2-17]|nr:hypothetical protein WSK_3042 [Novosphingobium sp. Rr 2-17]